MAFKVKIIKDSINANGQRLTTMELTQPRMIHSEFLTHRVFSRNAASSRAIPVQKMLSRVWNEPVVPVWLGKNQSGMQAKEELQGLRRALFLFLWLGASKLACMLAWLMMKLGAHKQLVNRVIEPWSWITVIVTATEWSNFFALRCHPDAQPEIQKVAMLAKQAYDESTPQLLGSSEYHLPLVDDLDILLNEGFSMDDVVKISVGRCARVSYLTHDGSRDPKADIKLCARLLGSGHMSPFEHVARPTANNKFSGNFFGWEQYRKQLPYEADFGDRLAQ